MLVVRMTRMELIESKTLSLSSRDCCYGDRRWMQLDVEFFYSSESSKHKYVRVKERRTETKNKKKKKVKIIHHISYCSFLFSRISRHHTKKITRKSTNTYVIVCFFFDK